MSRYGSFRVDLLVMSGWLTKAPGLALHAGPGPPSGQVELPWFRAQRRHDGTAPVDPTIEIQSRQRRPHRVTPGETMMWLRLRRQLRRISSKRAFQPA